MADIAKIAEDLSNLTVLEAAELDGPPSQVLCQSVHLDLNVCFLHSRA